MRLARRHRLPLAAVLLMTLAAAAARADDPPAGFSRGFPTDPAHFPIAVWLQSPDNAERYRDIGINTYVALWGGTTAEKLDKLDHAGIRLVSEPGRRTITEFLDRPTIAAWMHGDEPDNAQALPNDRGYGPPITPEAIIESYQRIRQADPTRPVLLNLGQGVAWDGWYGRGVRTNHPEDYPEYVKGCDIVSFDIYPASHDHDDIAGKLWKVPYGVDRLKQWTAGAKPIWVCIETTHISNPDRMPTPDEVRSEVWMSLIHGARGLIYFCHEFQPKFIEAGLLAYPEMSQAVAQINRQILELAPVINSPDVADRARVTPANAEVPIDFVVKQHADDTYLFAVAMRPGTTKARFDLDGLPPSARIEVLGENRTIDPRDGGWDDDFTTPYQVHLYRVATPPAPEAPQ